MAGFGVYRAVCVPVLKNRFRTEAYELGVMRSAPSWCRKIPSCPEMGCKRRICRVVSQMQLVFSADVRYQTAMSDESIENLARKLVDSVPEGLRSVRDDLENNFRSVLRSSLSKLDLVTREEFEVQEAVLLRTREKLEALEAQLEAIEKNTA